MSTYCSDPDTPDRGDYFIDVAYCCFGRDVRVILDHNAAYIEPNEARAMAGALMRCAEGAEQAARRYGR